MIAGNDGGCRYQRIVSGFQSHERFETDKPVVGDLNDRLVPGKDPVLGQGPGLRSRLPAYRSTCGSSIDEL
jgi:hypothetical protein